MRYYNIVVRFILFLQRKTRGRFQPRIVERLQGKQKKLDENVAQLCDQIEATAEDVCDSESFLTTLLFDSEIVSIKRKAYVLTYKSEKSFTLKGKAEPVRITLIYILMSEEMHNRIMYCPSDNIPKVYVLPTKYCDEIISFWGIDLVVH